MSNLSPQERMRRGPELSAAVGAVTAAMDRVAELRAIEQRIGNGKRGRPKAFPAELLDALPKRRGRPPKA